MGDNEAKKGNNSYISPVQIMSDFINITNAISLFPFAIVYDYKSNLFTSKQSAYHKKIVFALHLTVFISIGCEVWTQNCWEPITLNQWLYFIDETFWMGYLFLTLYVYWIKQEQIMELINNLHILYLRCCQGMPKMEHKISCYTLRILLPVMAFLWALVDALRVSREANSFNDMITAIMDRPQQYYLGRLNFTNSVQGKYNVEDYIIAAVGFFIHFFKCLIPCIGYIFILTSSVSIWLIISSFARQVKIMQHNAKDLQLVLEVLFQIRKSLNSCEEGVGILYGAWCLGLLPTYVIETPSSFVTQNWLVMIGSALYVLALIGVAIPAAEVHSRIKSISFWLQDYLNIDYSHSVVMQDQIPALDRFDTTANKLNSLIIVNVQQINGNSIGVSGKFFTISYGLLGNVCSLLLTYVVIVIQFKGIK